MKMNRYIVESFNRYIVELSNSESNPPNLTPAKPVQRFNGFQQCNEP
jgi:hypothetical protein